MFKWMHQLQTVKTELTQMASSKSTKEFEQKMEVFLEKLSTNPNVLNTLSLILNTQSQTKSLLNFTFEKLWKSIQLPNKKDQERTLYLLHELQFKIHQMDKEISRLRRPHLNDVTSIHSRAADNRGISVVEKRNSEIPISKLV